MDLDYVLSWMVGLGSGFGALTSLARFRLRLPGWLAIHTFLLAVVLLGALNHWPGVGYLTASVWVAFVLVPMASARKHFELVSQYRLERALFWARIAAWLHPFDGLPHQLHYFTALLLADRGQRERARSVLQRLRGAAGFQKLSQLAELRLDEEWDAIVEHVESQPVGTRDLRLAPWYVRGLGESGRTENMLATFLSMPSVVRQSLILQVQVAAFLGRVDLVQRLQERHFADNQSAHLEYWLAVAEQAQGNALDAKLKLGKLRQNPMLESRVALRLKTPAAVVDTSTWSPDSQTLLDRFAQLVSTTPTWVLTKRIRPYATWSMIALFCIVFALELPGGSETKENLVRLGALELPHTAGAASLAFRLLASGLLHYGPVHLALNVLSFWIIGPVLEREHGRWLVLSTFFAGSIGAFSLAYLYVPETVLLGGSAGIFGLVGALGVFSLVAYVKYRARIFLQRLAVVLLIVAAQLLFDWFTPITSSFLHMAGFGVGALVALPWALCTILPSKARKARAAGS